MKKGRSARNKKVLIFIWGTVFSSIVFIILLSSKFGRAFDILEFEEYIQFKLELEEKYALLELEGTVHEGTGIVINVCSEEILGLEKRERLIQEVEIFFEDKYIKDILQKKYSKKNIPIKINNIYFKYLNEDLYSTYYEIHNIN